MIEEGRTINILMVDDHQMFIDGIKSLLKSDSNIEFVGELNDGSQVLDFLKQNRVIDILITDISMPEMDGIELTKKVKSVFPDLKVLVLSMMNDKQIISEILLAEAEGYILKNTGKKELISAIYEIAAGGTHYSNEVLSIMLRKIKKQKNIDSETKTLTEREREVIGLIVKEYSTTAIAEKLFISPRTVDTHRKHIMQKTHSKTIVALIKFAFRNGFIE